MLKSSKNPAAAQRFLAFMVSKPGQEAMAKTSAEYPVLAGRRLAVPAAAAGRFQRAGDAGRHGQRIGGLCAGAGSRADLSTALQAVAAVAASAPPPLARRWRPGCRSAWCCCRSLYVVLRAWEAGPSGILADLIRPYTLGLLVNTLMLAGSVTVLAGAIATAAALVHRTLRRCRAGAGGGWRPRCRWRCRPMCRASRGPRSGPGSRRCRARS